MPAVDDPRPRRLEPALAQAKVGTDARPMRKTAYAASHATLRITEKRFSRSPYFECYANDRAVFGVYSGRFYPLTLGEDPVADYWVLRRKAAMFDVPEHPVEIAGPDAERLLDTVLTRNVAKLRPGRAAYALACFPDGGIIMDGVLLRLSDDRFWYVMADGEFFAWLAAHAMGLDVIVRDPGSWVLQVQGPRSLDILGAACDGAAPEPFPYFSVAECSMAGQRLLLSRSGWTGELGFELYTLEQEPDGRALWRHLMRAGEPYGMIFSSLESMGIRRIEAGIRDNGTDMDPTMTPYQAGLGAFVDLTDADFIGKGALETADKRRLVYGLKCRAATPVAGFAVVRGGARVGRLTTGAWSPFLDQGIGFARLDEPGDWEGAKVSMVSADGVDHPAELVSLPFYDRDKRIPRGLSVEIP